MSDAAPEDGGGYVPDDTTGHEAVVEQYEREKAEREEQLQESLSVKERLERAGEQETLHITVRDIPLRFGTPSASQENRLLELISGLQRLESGADEIELEEAGDVVNSVKELTERSAEHLADLSKDGLENAEWWLGEFGQFELVFAIQALIEETETVAQERVEQFRNE